MLIPIGLVLNKDRKHFDSKGLSVFFLGVKKTTFRVLICNPSSFGVLLFYWYFFSEDFNITVL